MKAPSDPVGVLVTFALEQMKTGMSLDQKVRLLRACGQIVLSEAESRKFISAADALEHAGKQEAQLWRFTEADAHCGAAGARQAGTRAKPRKVSGRGAR